MGYAKIIRTSYGQRTLLKPNSLALISAYVFVSIYIFVSLEMERDFMNQEIMNV